LETPTTRPGPETTRQLTRWLPAVTSATDGDRRRSIHAATTSLYERLGYGRQHI